MGKVKKAGAARKQRRTSAKQVPSKKELGTRTRAKPKAKLKAKLKTVKAAPEVSFAVRELDPVRKCGADTSVQLLYRVDESDGKVVRPHLVFFDKHGWYCEHGRGCPAVPFARRDARRNHASLVSAYEKMDRLKTVG